MVKFLQLRNYVSFHIVKDLEIRGKFMNSLKTLIIITVTVLGYLLSCSKTHFKNMIVIYVCMYLQTSFCHSVFYCNQEEKFHILFCFYRYLTLLSIFVSHCPRYIKSVRLVQKKTMPSLKLECQTLAGCSLLTCQFSLLNQPWF